MTLDYDNYYIVTEDNKGELGCLVSYKELSKAEEHAKRISVDFNTVSLILKPVAKVKAITHAEVEKC